ncbi:MULTISPECIES: acetyl-CoA carboxylase biotin carboxyl carrier protein [unclassified Paenibacillus]|uniref:acetyl-CoA carboxylase biotin carboxyl carrier protein n=1 Tax=unclassified Paenibacillus TaxID=185978 RepID=UPI001C0F68E0|nr:MULTISPECIES: acetyl-CoA carboxylase biotin carboxyl carrier protein [unclassified Paenibacillus]MBU5443028.1 acetyl-CoA carboxylase biotin carboxyl carrier protein [Paenibacillus sp. MSJ-34]CAH0118599.1 Biotin carboxyl carrier protein of acetyl-CoA carboxylase [Paenibacillus sp. CECT 9249]
MFKLSEIKELIKLVDQTTVQELEIENEGSRLLIRKPGKTELVNVQTAPIQQTFHPAPTAHIAAGPAADAAQAQGQANDAPAKAEQASNLHKIVSPMVGTFYQAPSPDASPYVKIGDKVKEKSVVCIIEAMKLMNELEAEVKGEIVDILVEDGQLVEFGQPLFLVKTE